MEVRTQPPLRQHRPQRKRIDLTELAHSRRLGAAPSERTDGTLVGVGVVYGQAWVEAHEPPLPQPVPGPLQVLVRRQPLVERATLPELTAERTRAVGISV